jgi:AcrR family transcriptional regulator
MAEKDNKLGRKAGTRGRPARSAQHVAEMRARIAEQAQILFLSEGYGAISMRRIASATGCTVMTLYRYYDRKIDILRHLWKMVFETLFDELEQVAETYSDPRQRLEAIALGYVRYWLENREIYFMVFMSSNVEQSDVSVFVQDDAIISRFMIFQRSLAQATSNTSDSDLAISSELLLCMLNGIAHNLITISAFPWSSPQVLVRTAIDSLLGTLRPTAA